MYFLKKIYIVYNHGSGAKPPEAGEFSRIFLLTVTLQSVRLISPASLPLGSRASVSDEWELNKN